MFECQTEDKESSSLPLIVTTELGICSADYKGLTTEFWKT